MNAFWKIFTDANTKEKASKVCNRFLKNLSAEHTGTDIQPYHKGGFTVSFSTAVSATAWPKIILEILSEAQNVGRSWVVSGDIKTELNAWSNDSSVSGVTNIHLLLENDG